MSNINQHVFSFCSGGTKLPMMLSTPDGFPNITVTGLKSHKSHGSYFPISCSCCYLSRFSSCGLPLSESSRHSRGFLIALLGKVPLPHAKGAGAGLSPSCLSRAIASHGCTAWPLKPGGAVLLCNFRDKPGPGLQGRTAEGSGSMSRPQGCPVWDCGTLGLWDSAS